MSMFRTAAIALGGAALAASTLAIAPANAADGYTATVKGVTSGKLIKSVKPNATPAVTVNNVPANTALYIMWCEMPMNPTTEAPKFCDLTNKDSMYSIPAMADVRNVKEKIKLRPTFTASKLTNHGETKSVDCEAPAQNNLGAVCGIYVVDSITSAPTLVSAQYFRIAFKDQTKKNDAATIKLGGKTIGSGSKPKLKYEVGVKLSVSLKSKIAARLSTSPECSYDHNTGKITALASSETCTLMVSSPGNSKYAPFTRVQNFTMVIDK